MGINFSKLIKVSGFTFGLVSTKYKTFDLGFDLNIQSNIFSSSTQRVLNPESGCEHLQIAA